MEEQQRPINDSQAWQGKQYGATNSALPEASSADGDQELCCRGCRCSGRTFPRSMCSSHCLQEDSEYWYEARVCFPCVMDAKDYFIRKVPFVKWLRRYTPSKFLSDVIAGITVGLMVVPQALAYAKIADLPLEVRDMKDLCTCRHTTHLHACTCTHHARTHARTHIHTLIHTLTLSFSHPHVGVVWLVLCLYGELCVHLFGHIKGHHSRTHSHHVTHRFLHSCGEWCCQGNLSPLCSSTLFPVWHNSIGDGCAQPR